MVQADRGDLRVPWSRALSFHLLPGLSPGCSLTQPRAGLSFLLCKVKVLGWRLLDGLSPGLHV